MNRNIINFTLSHINNKELYKLLNITKFTIDSQIMDFKRIKGNSIESLIKKGDLNDIILKLSIEKKYNNICNKKFIIPVYEMIHKTIQYGHLHILKWLFTKIDIYEDFKWKLIPDHFIKSSVLFNILVHAIKNEKLNIIKWLYKHHRGLMQYSPILKHANMDLFDYKNERHTRDPLCNIITEAAFNAKLNIIKWCHKKLFRRYQSEMESAVEGNHLHIVKWLIKNRPIDKYSPNLMGIAIDTNDINMCKFIYKHINFYRGLDFEKLICVAKKSYNNNNEIIDWLEKLYDNTLFDEENIMTLFT